MKASRPVLLAHVLAPLLLAPTTALKLHGISPRSRPAIAPRAAVVASADREILEANVVSSVQDGLAAGFQKPRRTFGALRAFGNATGGLIQIWLTPQTLEDCAVFWADGVTGLVIDARRLPRLRGLPQQLLAPVWFGMLTLNTFPFTPLLIPLIDRALDGIGDEGDFEQSRYVPAAFGARRRRAMRRLRHDSGDLSSAGAFRTPQNLQEGIRFFADGGKLLLRDVRRGNLLKSADDSWQTYACFGLLSVGTFPMTPLLLPSIDKRRAGVQSDYVPSAFSARRQAAYARLRGERDSRFEK